MSCHEISTIFKSNQHNIIRDIYNSIYVLDFIQCTLHFHTCTSVIQKLTCLSLDIASEEMNSFLLNLDTKHRVNGLFLVNPNSSSHRTYARKIWTSFQKLKGKGYIFVFQKLHLRNWKR